MQKRRQTAVCAAIVGIGTPLFRHSLAAQTAITPAIKVIEPAVCKAEAEHLGLSLALMGEL